MHAGFLLHCCCCSCRGQTDWICVCKTGKSSAVTLNRLNSDTESITVNESTVKRGHGVDVVKWSGALQCGNLSLTQRRSTPEWNWFGNYQHSAYKFPQCEKQCIQNESASIYLSDYPHTHTLFPNHLPCWRQIKKERKRDSPLGFSFSAPVPRRFYMYPLDYRWQIDADLGQPAGNGPAVIARRCFCLQRLHCCLLVFVKVQGGRREGFTAA